RSLDAVEVAHQAEVGDLDVVVNQEQVLRLDVEMLKLVLIIHQVQHFGGFVDVAQQVVARDAGLPQLAELGEAVPQVAVGELGDDDQPAFDDVVALQRQQVRVADGLDAAEGGQFLFGALVGGGVDVGVDDLDGFEQAAGGLALPDFAVAAAAQFGKEAVA